MKHLLSLLVISSLLLNCTPKVSESTDKPLENTSAHTSQLNPQIAIDFLNTYATIAHTLTEEELIQWVEVYPLVTQTFKLELKKTLTEARAKDPEIGLGADPIFDAQDYPEKGFKLLKFEKETGYLVAEGIGWEGFTVIMKVVNQAGKTLVDGCGIINIEENKRAER